jgi:hypothetical protein
MSSQRGGGPGREAPLAGWRGDEARWRWNASNRDPQARLRPSAVRPGLDAVRMPVPGGLLQVQQASPESPHLSNPCLSGLPSASLHPPLPRLTLDSVQPN